MSDNSFELINEYKEQIRILRQEVAELQDSHKPEIHFVDDNLSFDRSWTMEFLDKLAEKNLKLFHEKSHGKRWLHERRPLYLLSSA